MKPLGPCKGCGRTRLINVLGLCKRCNKEPSKFLSKKELEQIKLEQEAAAQAAREAKEAEAAAAAAAEAEAAAAGAEGEEGEEGEAPAEGDEAPAEGGDEAPKEDGGE